MVCVCRTSQTVYREIENTWKRSIITGVLSTQAGDHRIINVNNNGGYRKRFLIFVVFMLMEGQVKVTYKDSQPTQYLETIPDTDRNSNRDTNIETNSK